MFGWEEKNKRKKIKRKEFSFILLGKIEKEEKENKKMNFFIYLNKKSERKEN